MAEYTINTNLDISGYKKGVEKIKKDKEKLESTPISIPTKIEEPKKTSNNRSSRSRKFTAKNILDVDDNFIEEVLKERNKRKSDLYTKYNKIINDTAGMKDSLKKKDVDTIVDTLQRAFIADKSNKHLNGLFDDLIKENEELLNAFKNTKDVLKSFKDIASQIKSIDDIKRFSASNQKAIDVSKEPLANKQSSETIKTASKTMGEAAKTMDKAAKIIDNAVSNNDKKNISDNTAKIEQVKNTVAQVKNEIIQKVKNKELKTITSVLDSMKGLVFDAPLHHPEYKNGVPLGKLGPRTYFDKDGNEIFENSGGYGVANIDVFNTLMDAFGIKNEGDLRKLPRPTEQFEELELYWIEQFWKNIHADDEPKVENATTQSKVISRNNKIDASVNKFSKAVDEMAEIPKEIENVTSQSEIISTGNKASYATDLLPDEDRPSYEYANRPWWQRRGNEVELMWQKSNLVKDVTYEKETQQKRISSRLGELNATKNNIVEESNIERLDTYNTGLKDNIHQLDEVLQNMISRAEQLLSKAGVDPEKYPVYKGLLEQKNILNKYFNGEELDVREQNYINAAKTSYMDYKIKPLQDYATALQNKIDGSIISKRIADKQQEINSYIQQNGDRNNDEELKKLRDEEQTLIETQKRNNVTITATKKELERVNKEILNLSQQRDITQPGRNTYIDGRTWGIMIEKQSSEIKALEEELAYQRGLENRDETLINKLELTHKLQNNFPRRKLPVNLSEQGYRIDLKYYAQLQKESEDLNKQWLTFLAKLKNKLPIDYKEGAYAAKLRGEVPLDLPAEQSEDEVRYLYAYWSYQQRFLKEYNSIMNATKIDPNRKIKFEDFTNAEDIVATLYKSFYPFVERMIKKIPGDQVLIGQKPEEYNVYRDLPVNAKTKEDMIVEAEERAAQQLEEKTRRDAEAAEQAKIAEEKKQQDILESIGLLEDEIELQKVIVEQARYEYTLAKERNEKAQSFINSTYKNNNDYTKEEFAVRNYLHKLKSDFMAQQGVGIQKVNVLNQKIADVVNTPTDNLEDEEIIKLKTEKQNLVKELKATQDIISNAYQKEKYYRHILEEEYVNSEGFEAGAGESKLSKYIDRAKRGTLVKNDITEVSKQGLEIIENTFIDDLHKALSDFSDENKVFGDLPEESEFINAVKKLEQLEENLISATESVYYNKNYSIARQSAIDSGLMTAEQFDSLKINTARELEIWINDIASNFKKAKKAMDEYKLAIRREFGKEYFRDKGFEESKTSSSAKPSATKKKTTTSKKSASNNPPSNPPKNPPNKIPKDGIIISSPHVTIVDTNTTEVLKTNVVNISADEVNANGKSSATGESNSRKPVSPEEVSEFLNKISRLIVGAPNNGYSVAGLKNLKEKVRALDNPNGRADLKNWKLVQDQFSNLTTRARFNTANNSAYDKMLDLVTKIRIKEINRDNRGINKQRDSLASMLDNYALSNNLNNDAKKDDFLKGIYEKANISIAEKMLEEIQTNSGKLVSNIIDNTNKGIIYSDAFNDNADKILNVRDDLVKQLEEILMGSADGSVIGEVLIAANDYLDTLKDQIKQSTSSTSYVKTVDADVIDKRIADLQSIMNAAIRDSIGDQTLGVISKLNESMNAHIGNLNDFKNKDIRSASEYSSLIQEGDEIAATIKGIKEINTQYEKTYDLRKEIAETKLNTDGDEEYISNLTSELNIAYKAIRDYAKSKGMSSEFVESILGSHSEYQDVGASIARQIGKIQKDISNSMIRKKQQGFGYTKAFDDTVKEESVKAKELIRQLLNIENAGEDAEAIIRKAYRSLEDYRTRFIEAQSDKNVTVKVSQVSKLLNDAIELQNNTRGRGVSAEDRSKIYNLVNELQLLRVEGKKADEVVEGINREKYDNIKAEVMDLGSKYKQLGIYGVDAFTKIGRSLKAQFTAQIARYFSLYDIIRYVRTGINVIKELDTAMVELRKVTDGTEKEYAEFRETIRDTAVDIASTNKDLISSAADWARLGYSIKEATELAKDAQIFVNVGDGVDIKGATDMMITAMKAFNIEAEEALSIVDKYNEIGNNFALSATDIGDAMQRSASVLAASNTSFDESIALITAGNEIIQDPEKMGTALRTVALRIRGAKSELEEMGEETDYVVSSTSKLRDLIKGYTSINGKYEGFDIMEDEDTFKSLADIIKGIGEVYDEMSDIDRTAMLEKLAGKNRSNALAAMLQNYEQIDNVLKAIEESEGSALEENAHIVDSIQGRMTILQTSAENFWQEFIDTDAVKNAISALTELLNVLTEIVGKVGLLPTLTAGAGIGLVGSNGGIQRYFQIRQNANYAQQQYDLDKADHASALENFNDLDKVFQDTNIDAENLNDTFDKADEAWNTLAGATDKLTDSERKLENAQNALSKSAKNDLQPAIKGLIVTAGITAAVAAINYAIKKYQEAQQAVNEFAKETTKSNKSLDDYAKRIGEANKVLKDENSTTEQIRDAKNELITIQQELNESYGNYSTVIQDVNNDLREQNQLLIENQMLKNREAVRKSESTWNWRSIGSGSDRASTAEGIFNGRTGSNLGIWTNPVSAKLALNVLKDILPEEVLKNNNWETIELGTINFEASNYDELKTMLTQAQLELGREEYEGNLGASAASDFIQRTLDQMAKDENEYLDEWLLAAQDRMASEHYTEYEALMNSYYDNIQNPTEETERALKDNLMTMWEIASERNDEGAKKWLRSFFKTYADEIENAHLDEYWNRQAENGANLGDRAEVIGKWLGDSGLSKTQILNYLTGGDLSGFSSDQQEWLKLLKNTFEEMGVDYTQALDRLYSQGLFRENNQLTFEDDYQSYRDAAASRFGMLGSSFDALGIGTDEELTIWKNIAEQATSAAEAVAMYKLETSGLEKTSDASTMLKNMEAQYKPMFDAMATAYKAIWSDSGFDISKVTSEQLESVRSQVESLNNDLKEKGLEGFSTDQINDFILTLSDATTTEQEAHDAFNGLATTLVDSLNPALGQASGETALFVQKTLTEMGVTNAADVLFSRLGYSAETYAAAKEEANKNDIDIDAEIGDLTEEQIQLILNNEALLNYYKGRILANSITIETKEDVNNLIKLYKALGIATVGTLELAKAEEKLARADYLEHVAQNLGSGSYTASQYLKEANALRDEVANAISSAEVDWQPNVEWDANTMASSDKSGSDSKQKFDWIERAIKKIQRAVTNLGKVADATYKKWEERLGGVTGKYEKLQEEILLQQQAADAYMQEAYAIGLNPVYMDKVMNGLMDIETITDEKLKEQISDFQEYYDKSTDAADAVEDLRGEIAAIAQTRFDNITKQFEEMALSIDHAATRIGHLQSKLDSEGYFESSTFIEKLLFGDKEKLGQLEDEARQLAASIDEAVANGDIEYGSEQWWGMYDSLQNVNDQIVEMKSNIADLNDQLRQMEWDRFDYIQDSIERLRTENDFLVDTLETENQLFEKVQLMNTDIMVSNGNWTDAATAIQGLRVNNLQILKKQNEEVADEIKKINEDLANDPNSKKLLERRNDLIDQQQDIIKGITQEKQSIKSLIQEGYETFLDYLQKSIDKRKEALNAEKSLYDYERNVADQTKAIADYRKQLAALGGDDSEENRARMQQLRDDLTKAEKDLQDTEYERWLSDQEEMMDSMYESFENLINERLDDLDGLIESAIQQTADSAGTISQTIQEQADEFIYDLDNTSFGVNFDARISDAVTAVNAVENAINTMINAANVNAQNELAQLQALAQTIVTQAQVQAQQAAQVNVNTSNNGGDSGSGGSGSGGSGNENSIPRGSKANKTGVTLNKGVNTSQQNSAKIAELNKKIEMYYAAYDNAMKEYNKLTPNSYNYADRMSALQTAGYYQQLIDQAQDELRELNKSKFAQGGTIGKAVKSTGEDGIILARTGEEVLSLERIKQIQGIFKMMQPLAALGTNKTISNIGGTTTVNGMNVSFELPNVTSYEDFVRQAKNDPSFEKLVQNMTIGTALGKSKLSKYS